MTRGASPQRGRYLVRNRAWNAALRVTDGALGLFARDARQSAVAAPRRILVAIGGHRGDAVIATAALGEIHRRAPAAEIGVITGSWASEVLAGHPSVRWTHALDHWRVNRAAVSPLAKVSRYASTFADALREIRAVGYDLAIDLYPFYPNMAGLLWRAGIARRVGFASGGRGPLYSRCVDWVDDRAHMAIKHERLITAALGPAPLEADVAAASYTLAPPSIEERESADSKLEAAGVSGPYVVLHAGSGARLKEWPLQHWATLAGHLAERGFSLVVTGSGADETAAASWLASRVEQCRSLAGSLSWKEFVRVVAGARLCVSGDTVTAHVAAAVGTPCVVLFSGINDLREWRPLGSAVVPLINAVPCAPCFRGTGCATMSCVRGITPDVVAHHALELLTSRA